MPDPNIELSVEAIRAHCRGDPRNLPRFMVHDNGSWPWGVVRIDSRKRVHLRRADFLNVVAPAIPCRPGLWLGQNVQEFHIDLRADQLGGGADTRHAATRPDFRKLIRADRQGRIPGEPDYADDTPPADAAPARPGAPGEPAARPRSLAEIKADAARLVPRGPGE